MTQKNSTLRPNHYRLMATQGILRTLAGLPIALMALATVMSNRQLENHRLSFGMCLIYGVIIGIMKLWQNSYSSRFYLSAMGAFLVLGIPLLSIIKPELSLLSIEYLEMLFVSMLPTLFMAHQFKRLYNEKERALELMEQSFHIAHTDSMTGLPNRLALNLALDRLPQSGSLTFIDIDGLKYYNDKFGHARGDELLCSFAASLAVHLGNKATAYRLGGDEFAIICEEGEITWLKTMLQLTIESLRINGFAHANASSGSAYGYETCDKAKLQHLADCRMYENKRTNKCVSCDYQALLIPSRSIRDRKVVEGTPRILAAP